MPLITRTKAEILQRMKDRFKEAGYTDVTEVGSPSNVQVNAIAPELSSIYKSIEYAHNATDITKAVGVELDKLASLFGIKRGQTQPARDSSTNNVKFYIDPTINKTASTLAGEYNLNSILIPKGTVLSARGLQYRTTAEASMSGNSTEVFVPVVAMGAGSAYNIEAGELSSHNLASYTPLAKLAVFIKCTNLLPISSGQNAETDDELRKRIQNANSIGATANTLALLAAARAIPGVADAAIVPYIYGSGTVAIFIESTTPIVSPGLISSVQDTVDQIKAEGVRAYVLYPSYNGIKLKIEVTLGVGVDSDSYGTDVKSQLVDFINNLPRGESFNSKKLLPILSNNGAAVDARIVKIQVGDYNIYTRKLLNLRTFLATTQALSETEKWYTNSNLIDICIVNE